MPVDSLMPNKSSSSGRGFVVAGIVMLLMMGGLVVWKVKRDREPPPEVPSAVARTEPSSPPVLEAPPPPPPSLEELDAGKQEPRPEKVRRTAQGVCAGECKGTASAQLRSALASRGGRAKGCYERALRNNTAAEGRVLVSARVGPQGQICSVSVSDQGLGDPGVINCVRRMFETGTFPPPSGGCVDVAVPLRFVVAREDESR